MTRVLIIEDDQVIGQMLYLYFSGEGYAVHRVETARAGVQALVDYNPDVILLDLVLPDSEGTEICSEFRGLTDVPVIVVSMNEKVADRINALASGADDFICKPFSMQELKARIETVLRRKPGRVQAAESPNRLMAKTDKFVLDYERRLLFADGMKIEMTYSEWEIMKLFCTSPERVFAREELINAVRGVDSFINDRSIDVHIMNLRKKIEEDPKNPRHIKTVWKIGYKFIME
ncbi:response regulator [Cohnella sp. CFH 77786]|uniref:response regulator transcription factor n=1 Tax=Cohnella sp. CFH 77786 TaxID=2662265 RepID=UPI001C60A3E9|nr:response regulator transcription factor [Cohnella sp. CFH 77786]MBW5447348.1 response regulator [Cohnella sp. CFH 77786]